MSEAPVWSTKWATGLMDESKQATQKVIGLMDQVIARIQRLEARVSCIENDRQPADTSAIRAEISSIAKSVEIEDNREVLITGVPRATHLSLPDIAKKTLSVIRLSNLTSQVINTRKWMAKSCAKQFQKDPSKAPSSQLQVSHSSQTDKMSVVVEFWGRTSATRVCATQNR